MLFTGIVAFPTALVNDDENPVKCTPCPDGRCPSDFDEDMTIGLFSTSRQTTGVANFNEEWVNAYCIINEMTTVVQYFPYFVLLLALVLCMVQKISNK